MNIKEALIVFKPTYVVISQETNKHLTSLKEVLKFGYTGKILLEKPLSTVYRSIKNLNFNTDKIFLGYNLRFHPCIEKLKKILDNEKVLSASVYTGQYLPDWRPLRDYKKTYSSRKKDGGGVLLELSHELDYLTFLFGKCIKAVSWQDKLSNLEIDCHDSSVGIMSFQKCKFLSIHLNLLDRKARREIIVNTNENSYKIDLIKSVFEINNSREILKKNRNISYFLMHKDILLSNRKKISCSFDEGVNIMKLIHKLQLKRKFDLKCC